MGPVLGGVGLGLVWGWWIAMVTPPARVRPVKSAVVLGIASLLLVAGIYGLAGVPAVLGLICAAGLSALTGIAVRAELERARGDTR